MIAYRAFTQGWDRARKEAFIAHLLDIQVVFDEVGVPDVMPVCLVDAPPYEFAYEINERVSRAEVYVSVIPEGRENADDDIHKGKKGIPDPGIYTAFCSEHIPPGKGIGLYVNNEPNVYSEEEARVTFSWLAEVGKHLAEAGHFAVMGNFATTWPTREMLKLPEAKTYMQVLGEHSDVLRNGAHEYESDIIARPHGAIGDWVKWIEACQYHEIPTFETIITEGPWDGIKTNTRGIGEAMEHWSGSGEEKEIRAANELIAMLLSHYIHPLIRGWCLYIWTALIETAGKWRSYDPSQRPFFLAEMVKGMREVAEARKVMWDNWQLPDGNVEPEPDPEPEGKRVVLSMPFALRFRSAPGEDIIGTLRNGAVVYLTEYSPIYDEGLVWHEAELDDGTLGWFANVEGLGADPALPDVKLPEEDFTIETLERIVRILSSLIATIKEEGVTP